MPKTKPNKAPFAPKSKPKAADKKEKTGLKKERVAIKPVSRIKKAAGAKAIPPKKAIAPKAASLAKGKTVLATEIKAPVKEQPRLNTSVGQARLNDTQSGTARPNDKVGQVIPRLVSPKAAPPITPRPEFKKEIRPSPAISALKPKEPLSHLAPQKTVKPPLPKTDIVKAPRPEPKKEEVVISKPPPQLQEIEVDFPLSLRDLSTKLNQKPSVVIKMLMESGVFANMNQLLDEQLANKVAEKLGFILRKALTQEELVIKGHEAEAGASALSPRAPVITFMGHVDHGKTSLLDAIRKSKVAEKEYGGITQHIGAYVVNLPKGMITFLDTPGHEAFTAMRARGANLTDIVVLVVAADDGLMPQTKEAIDHARAAGVPIVVAMNKIDKPQADIDRVKKQLSEEGLNPEDWGGQTITVGVSAKTGEGIEQLLEMILLEAEMLELKADFGKPASGVVVDAKLSKGRGPVATVLVQDGILKAQDAFICGKFYGKIKAMYNDLGRQIDKVYPSMPAELTGLSGVPLAGDKFYVVSDEKTARQISLTKQEKSRLSQMQPHAKKITLEDISTQIKEGKIKELNIILKADVQGSLGALEDSLNKLSTAEVQIKIIHKGMGNINASDVVLASASGAVIIGFHVDADEAAKNTARQEEVDIRTYTVIYEAINDLRTAMEGLLEPKIKKIFIGSVLVRQVFDLSRSGKIAGCFVQKGKVMRTSNISVLRNGEPVFEGKLSSLKRFKDDVREVEAGLECGLSIADFNDYQAGDIIEVYALEKIARKL